jgi:hypothetical protein
VEMLFTGINKITFSLNLHSENSQTALAENEREKAGY